MIHHLAWILLQVTCLPGKRLHASIRIVSKNANYLGDFLLCWYKNRIAFVPSCQVFLPVRLSRVEPYVRSFKF